MRQRRFGVAARVVWGLWLGIALLGVWLSATDGEGAASFVAYSTFLLATATVGALVASRRPRNPIGWLLLGAGLSYVVGGLAVEEVSKDGGRGALQTLAAWLGTWIWIAGLAPLATFGLLLFPDGRLPSPRWRPVAWLAGAGIAALITGLALAPGRIEDLPIDNPVGLTGAPWIADGLDSRGDGGAAGRPGRLDRLAAAALPLGGPRGAPAAQVAGLRGQPSWSPASRSRSRSRLARISGPRHSNAIVTLSLATVPIAMGIAILRHRLYDVDVVINRTLVYGALTATLAASYVGGVLLAQLVIGAERARRRDLHARRRRALPPGAGAHPGPRRPPLLPPPLRRRAHARGVRHAAARRGRARPRGRRPARRRARDRPADPRLAVAAPVTIPGRPRATMVP